MLPPAYTWSLTAIAIAAGLAIGWTFRRFTNAEQAALARRKGRASLYAFRLYADEPALIFRAQKQLLLWNARYLAAMLRPTAVILLPAALLMSGLDTVYGRRPLAPGEAAIVTAQFSGAGGAGLPAPALLGRGIAVETPGVRIAGERQFCWRVRAGSGASGSVLLLVNGLALAKDVRAGAPSGPIAERRVASLLAWFRYPGESLLPGHFVRWIGVSYPAATVNVFGFGVYWLVWFIFVSLIAMWLAKRKPPHPSSQIPRAGPP
jgi:hypothetical protein